MIKPRPPELGEGGGTLLVPPFFGKLLDLIPIRGGRPDHSHHIKLTPPRLFKFRCICNHVDLTFMQTLSDYSPFFRRLEGPMYFQNIYIYIHFENQGLIHLLWVKQHIFWSNEIVVVLGQTRAQGNYPGCLERGVSTLLGKQTKKFCFLLLK